MLRIRTTISALTVATAMVLAGMGSAPAQAGRMSSTSASSGSAEGIGAAAGAAGLPATAAAADGYLYVWDGRNFTGASCRWFGDDGDYGYNSNGCGNWNDRVSSAWNNGYANAYPDVLFFRDIGYRGPSVCLYNGDAWASMGGWDNQVSSHKWVTC